MKGKALFFIVICIIGFVSFYVLRNFATPAQRECRIEEFGILFQCPRQTVIQYWPNIFYSDFVTITRQGIPAPQTTDELFYKDGLVISRSLLPEPYNSIPSAAGYIRRIGREEDERVGKGGIPSAPGPYTVIADSADDMFRHWDGAATVRTGIGGIAYMSIKDGYIYEIRINSPNSFTVEEMEEIVSTFVWQTPVR